MLVRKLSLWAFWFLSTSAWAALCLSLFLGRTTPLTLSRWWLVGLAGILFVSFATRLLFIAVLRRGMGATGTALSAQRRAALTDIPLAVTLPLLVLVYLSDGFNHTLNSHPLLQWTVIFVPIGAAIVIHEAILNRSAPHWANAFSRIPALNPRTIQFVQDLLAIALLVGLALLFFWPIFTGRVPIPADLLPYGPPWGGLLTNGPPVVRNPVGSDTLWLIYPYAHFRHLIAESTLFPLWNPYVFAGTPFLAESSNTQLLQPLHLLFAILPPGTAIAATMPLYLALAGISMYAYLRVIDLPRGSALIGAITFMLASVATWWLLLSYFLASVVWLLPMALVGVEITLRGRYRWGALVIASAIGLALLGNTQVAFYISLAISLYAAWMLAARWRRKELNKRSLLVQFGILTSSAILGFAIAAAQLLPSLELTQLSQRAAILGPTALVPLQLPQLLLLLLPGLAGYPPSGTIWGTGNFLETSLYVGLLPLTLALLASWTRPNRYLAWGAVLTIGSLLLALAWPKPEFLATIFPPYQLFPQQGRILLLAKFGLALMAAFGAKALLAHVKLSPGRILPLFATVAAILLGAATIAFAIQEWPAPMAEQYPKALSALRDSLMWLVAMALVSGGALLLVLRWGKHIPISCIALLTAATILDLAGFAAPLYTYVPVSALYPPTPMTAYLQEQREERLFRIIGVPRTTFLSNSAMVFGLSDARGYNALYPLRVLQFARLVNGLDPLAASSSTGGYTGFYSDHHRIDYDTLHDMRLLSLLNVEYIVLDKQYRPSPPLDLSELDFVMVQTGIRGGVLYRNPNVLPRALLVGSAMTVADSGEAAKRLQDPEFDPAQQVVLENAAALPSYPSPQESSVDVETYAPERVRIRVESDAPAWLLLTDTYFPGWQATVNGDAAPIYPANVLFRAVAIPQGSSTVEFTYQPASWRWGVRISLAALFIWLMILLYPLRNRFKTQRVHGKRAGLPAGLR